MSKAATFYFHDYETFGTNPTQDRACQFAGLRTDEQFNVIGEPLVIYCLPGSERLPHPEACLITGITPQEAQQKGLTEFEFIRQIHAEMAQPMTCSLGYNNFRFDDEFTRNLLYRNLYDPYAREWKYGNSRFDLIDVVRMFYALRPDGIEWPMRDEQTPSFKLQDLSAANGIEHSHAHDALSDVQATIALARLLRRQQPRLWQWALSLRHTGTVKQLLDSQKVLLHSSGKYAGSRGATALVLPLGQHPEIRSQVVVYDLMVDPRPFAALSVDELQDLLYTPTQDLPDELQRLPIKTIKTNRAPMLAPVSTLQGVDTERIGLDCDQCKHHQQLLEQQPLLIQRMLQTQAGRDFPRQTDPDQMLYAGFLPDEDRQLLQQLRKQPVADWPHPLPSGRDERIPELLFRFRARNFPETLNDAELQRWQQWCQKQLQDPDGMPVDQYLDNLQVLRQQGHDTAMLDQLETWARQLAPAH